MNMPSETARNYARSVRSQIASHSNLNDLPEAAWLAEYCSQPDANYPIILSFGESWSGPNEELRACLSEQVLHGHKHGYQLSVWGTASFLNMASRLIDREHGLGGDIGPRLAVAGFWSGSRAIISDYAALLSRRLGQLRVGFLSPGYDYGPVMSAVPNDTPAFRVSSCGSVDVDSYIDHILRERCNVVAINAQHNPSAIQMSEHDITRIVEVCLQRGIAMLVDDAHYALVEHGATRSSALKVLNELSKERSSQVPWLAVRSLGKQLGCNGWGIGIATGPRDVVDALVNKVRPLREYNRSAFLLDAIATYLDSDAAQLRLDEFISVIERNRRRLWTFLASRNALPPGWEMQVCSPFSTFWTLRGGGNVGKELSRKELLFGSGVLLGSLVMSPQGDAHGILESGYRIYLGVPEDVFSEALVRIGNAT